MYTVFLVLRSDSSKQFFVKGILLVVYTDLKAFKDVGTRTKVFFIRRNLNLLLFKHIQ